MTVSTEPLAQVVAEETDADPDRIVVLPNRLAPSMFNVARPRRDRLTVGWAGGASHDPDMMMFYPVIRRFLDRHPHADFHLIGHDFRALIRRPTVRLTRWSDSITAYWAAVDFDIGVAPLAHSYFSASKSGLKCLEYGALGIPCIASDEAPYRDVVVDGVTGFLVRSTHEWDRRLRELANDAALREQMGAAAKQHVMAHWSMADGWLDWVRAYQRLGVDCEARVA